MDEAAAGSQQNGLFGTDSGERDILAEAINLAPLEGLIIEIGLRRGGSMKTFLDCLAARNAPATIISIDCYGQIPYMVAEGQRVIFDYTNEMRNETLGGIYSYIQGKPINFMFFNLEDTEFFDRFADGVPIYANMGKTIVNEYGFIFIDAQHTLESVARATRFFLNGRDASGTILCFDDINAYNHDAIEEMIVHRGYQLIRRGQIKAFYRKS